MLQDFLTTRKVPVSTNLVSEHFSIDKDVDKIEKNLQEFFSAIDHRLEKNEQMSGETCGCFYVKKHHNKKEIVASLSYTNINPNLSRVTLSVYQLS